MRIVLAAVLVLHGAIHLLGFAQGFGLAEGAHLGRSIGRIEGALWLLAAVGFVAAAAVLVAAPPRWWVVGLPALVLSQVLIVLAWQGARFGTLVNLVVLAPLVLAILEARPTSFRSTYERDSASRVAQLAAVAPVVTEADLEGLPPLVGAYLRRVGVVGKPHVQGFRARFHGRFRQGFDGRWMDFASEQHNFTAPSARLFLMRASLFGVPIDGYHDFVGADARFRIRVLGIADVVDGRGPEMNRSETVTIFNDLCVLAPAALLDAAVRWTTIDARSVRGDYTRGGETISAVLEFDGEGDLVDFVSDDRCYSPDGRTNRKMTWSTPLRGHREFAGFRLPARGDATWKTSDGDFVYGEFTLDEIVFLPARAGREAEVPERSRGDA